MPLLCMHVFFISSPLSFNDVDSCDVEHFMIHLDNPKESPHLKFLITSEKTSSHEVTFMGFRDWV